MKRCAIFGLISDKNIGDVVIFDSYRYLLEASEEASEITFYPCDLLFHQRRWVRRFGKLLRKLGLQRAATILHTWVAKRNYRKKTKGASLITFAGGGLIKYKYQHLHTFVAGLIDAATERKIPVVLNSVGIEGYSEADDRCQLLKSYLNHKVVKVITTRDDIETLEKRYITNSDIYTQLTGDPAIFANRAYNITRDKESKTIGVGLIRGGIFRDNEIDLSDDEVVELYVSIIKELERRGESYQLFTNGLRADYQLGLKVVAALGRSEESMTILSPTNGEELTRIISTFRAIIAARMHATIIAYSLDIAAVGLVWNDKLSLFGNYINASENFIAAKDFDAELICDRVAEAKPYDLERRAEIERRITDSITRQLR